MLQRFVGLKIVVANLSCKIASSAGVFWAGESCLFMFVLL